MAKRIEARNLGQFDLFRKRQEHESNPPKLSLVPDQVAYTGPERRTSAEETLEIPILDRCRNIAKMLNVELNEDRRYAVVWDAPTSEEAFGELKDSEEHESDNNNVHVPTPRRRLRNDLAPEHVTPSMILTMQNIDTAPGWRLVHVDFTKNIMKGPEDKRWGLIKPDEVTTFFELKYITT